MKIIGSYVSPFVRKALVLMELKGLRYEIDPITPFFASDEFTTLSPLRRIPVLIDGDVALCDSSVICAYLDEAYPAPAVLPAQPADRARARWMEEYADTRLADLTIWGLFYQQFVHPLVWGEPGDTARIEQTRAIDLPEALDYLDTLLARDAYLDGRLGLGDIAIYAMLRNAEMVGVAIDPERHPVTRAHFDRVAAEPVVARLRTLEDIQRNATLAGRRQALLDAGAPLAATSIGGRTPRRGIMRL